MSQLITLRDPRSSRAEAYRTLRTNLGFARPEQPLRSLLVAAPALEADAPETAANLAVVSAQAGRRVIAVDADLRRPTFHTHFELPNDRGLTTALVDDDGGAAPPLQSGPVEGLRVLTSGPVPPNPAELLATRRMDQLLALLRDDCELLVVTAPPVVVVTDAAVLAPRLDGVLLVLHAGRTRRDRTAEARRVLDRVGAPLIGVVLSGVEEERGGYGVYGEHA